MSAQTSQYGTGVYENPLDTVASGGTVAGPNFLGDLNTALHANLASPQMLGGLAGALTGSDAAGQAISDATQGLANVGKNFGIFFVGLSLFALGALMVAFSFGDEIAHVMRQSAGTVKKAEALFG